MKIRIGADEIILWIRKNHLADKIPNSRLGQDFIYKTIMGLGGILTERNQESFWDTRADSKNIDELLLPKTSAQYEIETDKLPELYEKMSFPLKECNGTAEQ